MYKSKVIWLLEIQQNVSYWNIVIYYTAHLDCPKTASLHVEWFTSKWTEI